MYCCVSVVNRGEQVKRVKPFLGGTMKKITRTTAARKAHMPPVQTAKPRSRPVPSTSSSTNRNIKKINLALQGGGAHGAFTWGVMDQLLDDGRIKIEGISGTSAGSMNAVAYAYGNLIGGNAGAKAALEKFWRAVSDAGQRFSPIKTMPWERAMAGWADDNALAFEAFKSITNMFSPQQLNPLNFNPLLDILSEQIDFTALNTCQDTKLFLSATNVNTGKVRVFNTTEITAKSVMASACLPNMFQAVEIEGEYFWDGGYMGNPSLFPLFYATDAADVLIVHINPIERNTVPTTSAEIYNRVNEISFNSSLIKELRSVAFVQKLLDEGWLKDEHQDKLKYVFIHSLRADKVLADLSIASKFSSDWDFLQTLRERGRAEAAAWLAQNFDNLGARSTVDLRAEFLTSGSELVNSPKLRTTTSKARKKA